MVKNGGSDIWCSPVATLIINSSKCYSFLGGNIQKTNPGFSKIEQV